MDHPIVIENVGGEYMESVLVLEWTRAPGERIEAGDTIAIVETAKAATEIAASHGGFLKEILIRPGEEAPVGARLGLISDETPAMAVVAAPTAVLLGSIATPLPVTPFTKHARVVATPLSRRLALELGVDLSKVPGTGPGGRIKRRDIEAFQASRVPCEAAPVAPPRPAAAQELAQSAPPRPAGPGIPIVFLHGFGADRSAWRQVTPLLTRGLPVVAVEMPGHGAVPAMPVRGIEDLAFAVADQLQAMGITEAHLVGHSLGGATALSLTQLGPLAVRSLCLIAPAGLGPEIDAGFLDGFVAATRAESLEPWLARMVADPRRLPSGLAQAVLRAREKAGMVEAQRSIAARLFPEGTQSVRLAEALAGVTVPAKIIWGLADAIIPSRHAFVAPGTVGLHLLRDIGHVPQMECPAIVARLIDELVVARG